LSQDSRSINLKQQAYEVLQHYMELTSITQSQSCSPLYRRLGKGGISSDSPGGWFRPLSSDFIADVEILARKNLSPAEYDTFKAYYMNQTGEWVKVDTGALHLLRVKLGKVFEEHGLYPVQVYFAPKDLRGTQGTHASNL
jgi:hypothetical protein